MSRPWEPLWHVGSLCTPHLVWNHPGLCHDPRWPEPSSQAVVVMAQPSLQHLGLLWVMHGLGKWPCRSSRPTSCLAFCWTMWSTTMSLAWPKLTWKTLWSEKRESHSAPGCQPSVCPTPGCLGQQLQALGAVLLRLGLATLTANTFSTGSFSQLCEPGRPNGSGLHVCSFQVVSWPGWYAIQRQPPLSGYVQVSCCPPLSSSGHRAATVGADQPFVSFGKSQRDPQDHYSHHGAVCCLLYPLGAYPEVQTGVRANRMAWDALQPG